jgi:hypothetical protein
MKQGLPGSKLISIVDKTMFVLHIRTVLLVTVWPALLTTADMFDCGSYLIPYVKLHATMQQLRHYFKTL